MANSASAMMEPSLLAHLLEASLDPRQNKEAELKIKVEEKKPGLSLALLQITAAASFPPNTRLASALFFKNFVKRNWTDEEGNYRLPQEEVTSIKRELIGLMVAVPPSIQAQLGEAISVIADSDFWLRWDSLVDELVARLTPDNHVVNAGVLQVAHSIFSRWRPLFRSDELFTEVNHVLSKFATPYMAVLRNLDVSIDKDMANNTALQQDFVELDLAMQLFYDLSCQDLPPQFEDSLPFLADLLLKYLRFDVDLLHTTDDNEAGPLEHVKASIFEGLTLYVQKYYDAFGPYVKRFVENSWELLTTVGLEPKYDMLVSKAFNFLTSTTSNAEQAQPFNDNNVLAQVVERVILPNLTLRDSDVEMFEDEPIEFIRRDLEGSDSETRRRAATDFLGKLMEQFNTPVTNVVSTYVNHHLALYSENPAANWRSKDTAVYLFCSIAAKGTPTAARGVTQTNNLVDVGEFFSTNLAHDLTGSDIQPLLKVDAIKYLYLFRSIITRDQWQQALPLLVNRLADSHYVVYTYAAIAVERVLYLADENGKPLVDPAHIAPLSKDLLEHLFSLVKRDVAPEKIQENEFLMRCVMRVLIVIKEAVVPITDSVLPHLLTITNIINQNPSNPRFYYYHFEAIGALIRFSGSLQASKMQEAFFGPFVVILQNSIEEFMPYVFQLFAAMLEIEPKQPLPQLFQSLIAPIIAPPVWEQRGNVPALVRLLTAIIPRSVDDLIKSNQLEGVLGIFQKLVSTKVYESYGFDLLEGVMEHFPSSALEPYWVHIITIMLTRLQDQQSTGFQLRFVRFYHFASSREDLGLGTDKFIAETDKVQQDVFRSLYLSIILPKTQQLARPLDRKTAAISLTKVLADSEAFVARYPKGWPHTCNALLKLLENPPVPARGEDMITDHDVDDSSFGVGFTQLQTIKRPTNDPWADVTDLRKWVGQYLRSADGRHSGRIAKFVDGGLSDDAKQALSMYMHL